MTKIIVLYCSFSFYYFILISVLYRKSDVKLEQRFTSQDLDSLQDAFIVSSLLLQLINNNKLL